MIPLLPAALKLAAVAAPSLVRYLTGSDRAEEAARRVVDVASALSGAPDADAAVAAVAADPALQARLTEALRQLELDLYREETERLRLVAETMRAEAASGDAYVRRWRPTWGYVTAATWALQAIGVVACLIGAVVATIGGKTEAVTALLNGAASLAGALSVQWAVALAVLGVAVQARSHDKAVKLTGEPPPPGILGALAARIGGGR